LTKEQVKDLPEFSDDLKVDYDYEERVRGLSHSAFRDIATFGSISTFRRTCDAYALCGSMTGAIPYDRDTTYEQEPDLYDLIRINKPSNCTKNG